MSACGISARAAGRVIRDWMYRQHEEYLQSTGGQGQTKSFLSEVSAKRAV
jgi:hypothetical protein